MSNEVKIIGHRGMGKGANENTIGGLLNCLHVADGIETDVVCSADGVPFLIHDRAIRFIPYIHSWTVSEWQKKLDPSSLRMTCGKDFTALSADLIDRLRFKTGAHIPRLSELFHRISRMAHPSAKGIINLELKGPNVARAVVGEIAAASASGKIDESRIVISSFDHAQVKETQSLNPLLRTGLIFWHDSIRPCRLYPGTDNEAKALPVSIANLENKMIRSILPDYFILPVGGLTNIYNAAVANEYSKTKFIVWTPGREPQPRNHAVLMEKLADPEIGPRIAAVVTNHPLAMKNFFSPL